MKPLTIVSALVGAAASVTAQLPLQYAVPGYVVLSSPNHVGNGGAYTPHPNVLQYGHPYYGGGVPFGLQTIQPRAGLAFPGHNGGYKPFVQFAWPGHPADRYQQPINNLPPLPPIPEGYPPLPSIPPPGGPGTVIITPGTPVVPPPTPVRPPQPPVAPTRPPTTPRPVVPVTQPRPPPVVVPTTPRPVTQPPRPVTRPPKPVTRPTTPRPQPPRPVDDDDEVADPISHPPVLSADRSPMYQFFANRASAGYHPDAADVLVDPVEVVNIKGDFN